MKRHFLLALSAAALVFASGSALANEDCEFSDELDDNADCRVSEDEFVGHYKQSGVYAIWDSNGDGWISEEEFGAGLYDYYDRDDDGVIVEDEIEIANDPSEDASDF